MPVPVPAVMVLVVLLPDIDLLSWSAVIPAVFVINGRRCRIDARSRPIFPVTGDIHLLVPTVIDKIYRPAARLISIAVTIPTLSVSWRHPQVYRRMPYFDWSHDNGLLIDQPRRRKTANINSAVKVRLGDTDRYASHAGAACRHE